MINCDDRSGRRTFCWFCGAEMIWGCDYSFDDYCIEGEGIVATLSCSNELCGASAEFYTKIMEGEIQ